MLNMGNLWGTQTYRSFHMMKAPGAEVHKDNMLAEQVEQRKDLVENIYSHIKVLSKSLNI